MAAFHLRTFELLREALRHETGQYNQAVGRLNRLPEGSQSKLAAALRERMGAFPEVSRDLERLIAFMEGVNETYVEHVDYAEADAVREIRNEMALEAAGVESWEDL